MRIISGSHKGKRISAPKGLPVRPTTDFAKEGLFNMLRNNYYLEELDVLDLFAGIGGVSFEFASRGVNSITSVDRHYGCVRFLKKTSEDLGLGMQVVRSDCLEFLRKTDACFDLIFMDPPYAIELKEVEMLHHTIMDRKLLNADGVLIIEHTKHLDLSKLPGWQDSRKYGGTVFSFFE